MSCLQPVIHLLSPNAQAPYDQREIGRRDAGRQVVACGVSLLRMRVDFAHPPPESFGIQRRQRMFERAMKTSPALSTATPCDSVPASKPLVGRVIWGP